MEVVKHIKEKMTILKYVIAIDNLEELNQIENFIKEISKELTDTDRLASKDFQIWNEQFNDTKNLNEPIEEYGMTLGELRKMIYESEQSESFPIDDFQKKLKKLYNET